MPLFNKVTVVLKWQNKNYGDVQFDISRLANGHSQLTLTDNSQGTTSSNMAAEVKTAIERGLLTHQVFKQNINM